MKKNKEKVPEFDDIIFRDRNKDYGAYDLRRRYSSTMSISLVVGLSFSISLVLIPFFAYRSGGPRNRGKDRHNRQLLIPHCLIRLYFPKYLPLQKPPAEAVNQVRFVPTGDRR